MRRSIDIPGIHHTNPIPAASLVGNILASGSIFGKDPANGGKFVEGVDAQCEMMFANIVRLMEAAGGSTDHIVKLEVWVKEAKTRAIVNQHWLKMFPDEASRPARHTFIDPDLQAEAHLQCAVLAVLV